jgi:NAD(P)H-nitrite reductase large subunit
MEKTMREKSIDCLVCRCEEVTEEQILEAIQEGCHTPKAIKRRTRAGMGLCQGRTCQRIVLSILSRETSSKPEDFESDSSRFPVRPVRIELIAELTNGKED